MLVCRDSRREPQVGKGEVVALLGPNGLAKQQHLTTSGLLKALEGSIAVLGEQSNWCTTQKSKTWFSTSPKTDPYFRIDCPGELEIRSTWRTK